ncbi:helicase-related protein [Myxococcus xanthus]|uniref:helicase-related protein n=1 Tax=Myxococcus xanthus TaxID=34 RepID=UPI0020A399DA|nr:helicase-related protein [Myxococcus xanthus]
MERRERTWLRSFLHLDARADSTVVPLRDIERQEDTVLRALEMFDDQPGVVLADEVGMGKTYEALGVLAARLHLMPDARALILTPGPDLNTKWSKELRAFCDTSRPMYRGFAGQSKAASTLAELVAAARETRITIAPVNIFAGSRSLADQAWLLSLWADAQGLAGNQVAAIFRRYREGAVARVDVEQQAFLDTFEWSVIRPHVREALRRHKQRAGEGSLDALWKSEEYDGFANQRWVDDALMDLRFRLVGQLIPDFDLLIVDEAHKLKNVDSVRATGVRTVFEGRFDKALFLTATPFQLSVDELKQVLSLFALARSAPADLMEQAQRLLDDVADYKQAYNELERVWSQADEAVVSDFGALFSRDPQLVEEPADASLRAVVLCARRLLSLKAERIEPGFRRWMIRSLREDKRVYRRSHRSRLRAQGGAGVPFMLYERFIAELFREKSRTHKAAVQINMVSSYGAAREGALLSSERQALPDGDAEVYRGLLRSVVGELRVEQGGHPKVDHVVRDALEAVARDEKTLIFCARIETLRELKRRIEAEWENLLLERWRKVFPAASHGDIFEHELGGKRVDGHHSRLRDRFGRAQDALYLALRERYTGTLLESVVVEGAHLERVIERANGLLRQQRVSKTQAERMDWSLVKRCVEQAVALFVRDGVLAGDVDPEVLRRLTDARFVALGFDLVADDVEDSAEGDRTPSWSIDAGAAALVLRREHLWSYLKAPLLEVPPELRIRTVERLASYLVARNVPFLPELLAFAKEQGVDVEAVESRALLSVVDRFWTTPRGRPWFELLKRFLTYAGKLDEERRREVLDDAVHAGALVRHTVDGESRERLREAFNTPLYPMVLVANEVMQEGLDLHHHCRRVVHHDLAWNPAQLEQRVGRVDRLGSLVQRLRARQPDTTLDVHLPLIANTIDERLERTVRLRERWLEFLLGAAPRIEEYGLADDPLKPLPEAFAQALRVELGPVAKARLPDG